MGRLKVNYFNQSTNEHRLANRAFNKEI